MPRYKKKTFFEPQKIAKKKRKALSQPRTGTEYSEAGNSHVYIDVDPGPGDLIETAIADGNHGGNEPAIADDGNHGGNKTAVADGNHGGNEPAIANGNHGGNKTAVADNGSHGGNEPAIADDGNHGGDENDCEPWNGPTYVFEAKNTDSTDNLCIRLMDHNYTIEAENINSPNTDGEPAIDRNYRVKLENTDSSQDGGCEAVTGHSYSVETGNTVSHDRINEPSIDLNLNIKVENTESEDSNCDSLIDSKHGFGAENTGRSQNTVGGLSIGQNLKIKVENTDIQESTCESWTGRSVETGNTGSQGGIHEPSIGHSYTVETRNTGSQGGIHGPSIGRSYTGNTGSQGGIHGPSIGRSYTVETRNTGSQGGIHGPSIGRSYTGNTGSQGGIHGPSIGRSYTVGTGDTGSQGGIHEPSIGRSYTENTGSQGGIHGPSIGRSYTENTGSQGGIHEPSIGRSYSIKVGNTESQGSDCEPLIGSNQRFEAENTGSQNIGNYINISISHNYNREVESNDTSNSVSAALADHGYTLDSDCGDDTQLSTRPSYNSHPTINSVSTQCSGLPLIPTIGNLALLRSGQPHCRRLSDNSSATVEDKRESNPMDDNFFCTDSVVTVSTTESAYHELRNNLMHDLHSKYMLNTCSKGIQILQFYEHGQKTLVKIRISVNEDFKLSLQIHQINIADTHDIFTGVPKAVKTVKELNAFLQKLAEYEICIGNADSELQDLVPLGNGIFESKRLGGLGYQEGDFCALYNNTFLYHSTIRSVKCGFLVRNQSMRCRQCGYLRTWLFEKKRTEDNRSKTRNFLQSHYKNTDMNREMLIEKIKQQADKIKGLEANVRTLSRLEKKTEEREKLARWKTEEREKIAREKAEDKKKKAEEREKIAREKAEEREKIARLKAEEKEKKAEEREKKAEQTAELKAEQTAMQKAEKTMKRKLQNIQPSSSKRICLLLVSETGTTPHASIATDGTADGNRTTPHETGTTPHASIATEGNHTTPHASIATEGTADGNRTTPHETGTIPHASIATEGTADGNRTTPHAADGTADGNRTTPHATEGTADGNRTTPDETGTTPHTSISTEGNRTTPHASEGTADGNRTTPHAADGTADGNRTTPHATEGTADGNRTTPHETGTTPYTSISTERNRTTPHATEGTANGNRTTPHATEGTADGNGIRPAAEPDSGQLPDPDITRLPDQDKDQLPDQDTEQLLDPDADLRPDPDADLLPDPDSDQLPDTDIGQLLEADPQFSDTEIDFGGEHSLGKEDTGHEKATTLHDIKSSSGKEDTGHERAATLHNTEATEGAADEKDSDRSTDHVGEDSKDASITYGHGHGEDSKDASITSGHGDGDDGSLLPDQHTCSKDAVAEENTVVVDGTRRRKLFKSASKSNGANTTQVTFDATFGSVTETDVIEEEDVMTENRSSNVDDDGGIPSPRHHRTRVSRTFSPEWDDESLDGFSSSSDGVPNKNDECTSADWTPDIDTECSSSDSDVSYSSEVESSDAADDKILDQSETDNCNATQGGNIQISNNKYKWGKKHSCKFCTKMIRKMSVHLRRLHANEPEVAAILDLPKGSRIRKNAFLKLLHEGDYQHNYKVYQGESGELIPKYRSAKRVPQDFVVCCTCKGLYLRHLIAKHAGRCVLNVGKDVLKKGEALHMGSLMLPVAEYISSSLYKTIISKMRRDDITQSVMDDRLIVQFGEQIYGNRNDEDHAATVRARMRELGRLLKLLRCSSQMQVSTLSTALDPINFDLLVSCVKQQANFDESTNAFKNGNVAIRLGDSLKKCCEVAKAAAEKSNDAALEEKMNGFQNRFDGEWNDAVGDCATRSLRARLNKPQISTNPSLADAARLNKPQISTNPSLADTARLNKPQISTNSSLADTARLNKPQISTNPSLVDVASTNPSLADVARLNKPQISTNPSLADTASTNPSLADTARLNIPQISTNSSLADAAKLSHVMDDEQVHSYVTLACTSLGYITDPDSGETNENDADTGETNENDADTGETNENDADSDINGTATGIVDLQHAKVTDGTGIVDSQHAKVTDGTGIFDLQNAKVTDGTGIFDLQNAKVTDGTGIFDLQNAKVTIGTRVFDLQHAEVIDTSEVHVGKKIKKKRSTDKIDAGKTIKKIRWSKDEVDAVKKHLSHCIDMNKVPQKREAEAAIAADPGLQHRSWRDVKYFVYNLVKKRRP